MMSKNLKNINPDLTVSFKDVRNEPAKVTATYNNGSTWSAVTSGYRINQLRNEFYEGAIAAEELFELENEVDDLGEGGAKKGDAKGKGKK